LIPLDQLRAARARLAPHVRRTPVVAADDGALLKLENLQPTGSYKVCGFFAAALALSPGPKTVAVVSGGNIARSLLAELLVDSERV
jgi:threonine dehydratase